VSTPRHQSRRPRELRATSRIGHMPQGAREIRRSGTAERSPGRHIVSLELARRWRAGTRVDLAAPRRSGPDAPRAAHRRFTHRRSFVTRIASGRRLRRAILARSTVAERSHFASPSVARASAASSAGDREYGGRVPRPCRPASSEVGWLQHLQQPPEPRACGHVLEATAGVVHPDARTRPTRSVGTLGAEITPAERSLRVRRRSMERRRRRRDTVRRSRARRRDDRGRRTRIT
jgi:hypothetical protein